jgi:hypothetical protein
MSELLSCWPELRDVDGARREVGNGRRLSYRCHMDFARQPSFRYSISCEEIYEIAHERTQTFLATHPEATPEEIEDAITVIADDLTPPASSTRLLLELAMQGEELMRRPLPEFFFAGCNCGCPRPTLGDLLRESYLIELKIDLLYAAGVLDELLDEDDEEAPESPRSEPPRPRAATATPAERQAENLLRSIELDPKLRQS